MKRIKPFSSLKFLKSKPTYIVTGIAVVGFMLLSIGSAATSFVSKEAEDGAVAGCAQNVNDSSASSGQYVVFGCQVTPGQLVIISPDSELDTIKQAVKNGGKKQYWDYIKSKGYIADPRAVHIPDWSQDVTYGISCGTYTFNPTTYKSTDHPNACSADAQGRYMHNAALNAYTTALRWRFDDDQANGDHALTLINSWVDNFESVVPNIRQNTDNRDNQLRLNSAWFVASFTKAVEIMWDHPNFTLERKQQTADWLWRNFLQEDPIMHEDNTEVLGQQQAGWNGRTGNLLARLNSGLVMKAAGHPSGEEVVNQTIVAINDVLPEILYYGKEPWHEALGQPWPKQPYRKLSPTYAGFNTPSNLKDYWFFTASSSSPPPFFVGQTQETGRDVAHNQLGVGAVAEMLRSLRLNGYDDMFSSSKIGDVLREMGEQHAAYYNETLDEFWDGGYSSLDSIKNGVWEPSGWNQFKFKVQFCVCGEGADHGWEYLRTELKRAGYTTPQLDRLTTRLRGVGPQTSNNAAGYVPLRTANNQAWEPLFAPDYQ